MPYVEKKYRDNLSDISMKVFGVSSRWYTIMRKRNLSLEQITKVMDEMLKRLNEQEKVND